MDARLRRSQAAEPEDAVPLSYVVYGDPTEEAGVDWGHVLALWNLRLNWAGEYGRDRDSSRLLHEILDRAARVTTSWEGEFVFVYLPSHPRFRSALARTEADAYRREVLRVVKALDLPVLDLTPVFQRQESPLRLFDAHYSIAGNALVARTFVSAVKSGVPAD